MKACTLQQVNGQDALPQQWGNPSEAARPPFPIRGSAIQMALSLQGESVLIPSPFHHTSDFLGSKGAGD